MARISNIFRHPIAGIVTILCAMLSHGCSNGVAYNEFVQLPEDVWEQDSLAVFRVDVTDTISAYDVWLQVRNNNDYPYSNLWLFVDVISPDGHARRDTVECILAYPDGSWCGSGWGSLYTERCVYMSNVRFSIGGPYTFRLMQGMRAENLEGLHDIGLLIERHEDRGADGEE